MTTTMTIAIANMQPNYLQRYKIIFIILPAAIHYFIFLQLSGGRQSDKRKISNRLLRITSL